MGSAQLAAAVVTARGHGVVQHAARRKDVFDTYRTDDPDHAMPKFMAHAGLAKAPVQDPVASRRGPTPEQQATMRAAAEVFLAHLLRPATRLTHPT